MLPETFPAGIDDVSKSTIFSMQTFQITNGPPSGPKNYVFVDEHNRHKRLKVMRACEGCRRRKIKCDAATTNTWPCAACKRLKLPCVPPAGGSEFDQATNEDLKADQQPPKAVNHTVSIPFDSYAQFQGPPVQHMPNYNHNEVHPSRQPYLPDAYQYAPQHHIQNAHPMNDAYTQRFTSLDTSDVTVVSQQSIASPITPDNQTAESLSEQLGELRIGENGVAPYARQQRPSDNEPDGPIQDSEIDLPPLSTAAGSQIRIPPALMPDDDDADESFRTFFQHVHPYVPVLCRSQFYHQWQNERQSLSPLLVEAILACAGRVSGEPVEESPWLVLANKHEPSFLDTPRLSTVQALLLLIKAREGSPKKGYFYKSWMTCKTAVSMAKDLDIHEHHAIHSSGEPCESSASECIVKTRIWQTIMVCELMIGAPQGRFNFEVDGDSVDLSSNPINSDIDEYESKISHQWSFFARNVLNIRRCAEGYVKVKRKKDWALDPIFDKLHVEFDGWPEELPEDLKMSLPPDGAMPHLPSHFIGNMHSHYHLGIIMLHRPQIVALAKQSSFNDGQWRRNMLLCYSAAKRLCCIQEAMVAQYDMLGLLCMQRGMSYTVYSILTCIMLHLIALTSPDPEFNVDAREYFVRHMRLLERCMPEWPLPETDKQINNLRAAFSADLDRPFDLKRSFPYSSPSNSVSSLRRPSEPRSDYMPPSEQAYYQQPQQYSQPPQSYFPTPPISNVNGESNPQTPQFYPNYSLGEQPHTQYRHIGPTSYPQQNINSSHVWNPSPIIDQFNTAFAIPASALQPPNPMYGTSPPIPLPPNIPQQQFTPSPQTPTYDLNAFARHQAQAHAEAQARAQAQAVQGHQRQQAQPMVNPHQQAPQRPQQSTYFEPTSHPGTTQPMPTLQTLLPEARNMHDQSPATPQSGNQSQAHMPGMVYVSAKEWQQSVASVFDPGGMKRRWTFDMQLAQ